jgi:hypothetical protein
LARLTELIYHILTAGFAFGESPLSSPQQAGGYPAKAFYEFADEQMMGFFLYLFENLPKTLEYEP